MKRITRRQKNLKRLITKHGDRTKPVALSQRTTYSFEEAKRAVEDLSKALGNPDWLLGVGVGIESDGHYCVSVHVDVDVIKTPVPQLVNNISVRIDRRRKPHAKNSRVWRNSRA